MSRIQVVSIIVAILAAICAPALLQGYAALGRAGNEEASKEYAAAAADYKSAARLLPWKAELWEKAGLEYAAAKDWQHAMPLLEKARQRGALSADGWDVFGTGYWLQSDNARALEVWSAGLSEHPQAAKFHARLALAYRGLGDYEEERHSLEGWVVTGQATAAEHYRLGELLMDSDARRARAELDEAARLDRAFGPAVQTLVAALDLAGQQAGRTQQLIAIGRSLGLVDEWPLAERAFRQGTEADPRDAQAWAWLGEARQHTGGNGSIELDRALALEPGNAVVRALRGLHFKRAGDLQALLEEYSKAAALDPQSPEWQAALGEAYALNGDLVAALAAYQQATALAPEKADYWRALAMFCADNSVQLLEVGIPAAKKAAAIAPSDPQVLDTLGWTHAQAGLLYTAEEALTKATKQAPDFALAHLHLGETYLRKGDWISARRELDLAKQLDADGPVGAMAGQLLKQYFP